MQSFATLKSEAFASDPVLNLGWIPDAFAFLASCLLFRPLFSRIALTGLRRVFSRSRISESCATDERGDPELEGSLLGREDTEVLFFSVVDICFADVAPRRAHCDRLNLSLFLSEVLSALLMLPLSPDSLTRHRPVRPPRSRLARWLPSLAPLSSPVDYTRPLRVSRGSWYQIVGYPGDLVFYRSARRLFSPVEWNEGCWRV